MVLDVKKINVGTKQSRNTLHYRKLHFKKVEHFQIVLDDKRNNIIFQAFHEHNHPAYTAVAVLKLVDSFKLNMKI